MDSQVIAPSATSLETPFTLHCGKWSTLQYDICIDLDVIAHIRLRLQSQMLYAQCAYTVIIKMYKCLAIWAVCLVATPQHYGKKKVWLTQWKMMTAVDSKWENRPFSFCPLMALRIVNPPNCVSWGTSAGSILFYFVQSIIYLQKTRSKYSQF